MRKLSNTNKAFTLAEVLIAKRESGKMNLFSLSRTRKLKAPSNKVIGRCAFTLAEVLITLGIIGVVAALTIPTLIQNQQEKATVTAVKKAYAALSQAYTMAEQEYGTPDNWNLIGSDSGPGTVNMLNTLGAYLKIEKNCGNGTGCFPNVTYKYLNGSGEENADAAAFRARAMLTDGSLIECTTRSKDCTQVRGSSLATANSCGIILIDINGFKGPNQQGIDTFDFLLTKYGIVPEGTVYDSFQSFNGGCNDKSTSTGFACAAWVIYNENMDYLKCTGLAWGGKTKC